MPQLPSAAARARPVRSIPATVAADILAADSRRSRCCLSTASNPVFATPAGWKAREALSKVPFIVSFGSFVDDTSVLADLILPDHSFLESWTDARPESGATWRSRPSRGPAMKPLHETRATPDVLLDVARKLKKPLDPALPWQTFDEMLQARELPATGSDERGRRRTKQGWAEWRRN